ncbi:MAG: C1 family peptidase [Thermus sp.]|uniref:C1 family peptidase n=1 Tax=Thermus sp. TaxID=275 RepID=UPI00298F170E|nr:C1 family peptidase [Thermus sp.]MDW8018250.1 C1 family peptidase [Thermus sp.]
MKPKLMLALFLGILGACTSPSPQGGPVGPDIQEFLTVGGYPAVRLGNGEVKRLDKPEETAWYLDRFPPPATPGLAQVGPQNLPLAVDLTPYQTPVKDQGGRGTCTAFAVVGALEAAYKRAYNLTLDLSEEFLNWQDKVNVLDTQSPPVPPSQSENFLAVWGGGSANYKLQNIMNGKLGIPLESQAPYNGQESFGDSGKWLPPITRNSPQRLMGDANLSQRTQTYNIPTPLDWLMLPQVALEEGRYRANQVVFASSNQLTNLDWFKAQLAAGREVAFGVHIPNKGKGVKGGIWMPGDMDWADHAMLMVGYDDSKQAFRVKNSWGTSWNEGGYVWMSYEFVQRGKVYEAASILSVMPPNFAVYTPQLFFGRYLLSHDGWRGVLDIYHIPNPSLFRFQNDTDRRLGTYYGADGMARRVNGVIHGRQIEFYLDWGNTVARSYGELSGMRFTGFLADDNRTLAGTLDDGSGTTQGFYAVKLRDYLSGTPGGSLGLSAYLGNWQIDGLDVTAGSFSITAVNPSTGQVTGTVFGGDPLVGTVSPTQPRRFTFQLGGQSYEGYMLALDPGVMAGKVGSSKGFIATRRDFSAPQVSIQSPQSGATLYRTQTYTLSGQARGDNGSGFIVDLPCRWASSDAGDTQFPLQGSCNPTFTLRPGSPASVTFTLSATAQGGASAQTSVTVNVQNPPNSGPPSVSIIEPASGSSASVGSTVTLGGRAVGGTPPYRNYRWSWQASKPGCAEIDISVRALPNQPIGGGQYWEWNTAGAQNIPNGCGFDNAGGTLRLYVTDDLNLTGSASIAFRLFYVPPPN